MISLSSDLFKKYTVPGPRYTSYPTVPYWEESPTVERWLETVSQALDQSEQTGIGAAVYIHIPFCESLCTYCACNTRITRNRGVGSGYVDAVLKEWELYRSRLGRPLTLSEIHLGGGTPTFLEAKDLRRLIEGILGSASVASSFEFSLEADPRVTQLDQLEELVALGFRRLSLGIQDFDPVVQHAVHRIQTEEQVRLITEGARSLGFSGINYDLIYGLPFQNLTSIENTIDAVRRLMPDRIAFYGYAHVPWIRPGQRRFTEEDLPSADVKRALYERGREMLEQVGYREIGMDHFALESDSLYRAAVEGSLHRNFMGYSARQVSPLIGLGVSSISDSWLAFAQNEKVLETYLARVEKGEIPVVRGHVLTDEDLILRRHILNLMTRFKTTWHSPGLRTAHLDSIPERLNELQGDGLVQVSGESCEITDLGRAFMRNICMAFDARLTRKAPSAQLFSKTV